VGLRNDQRSKEGSRPPPSRAGQRSPANGVGRSRARARTGLYHSELVPDPAQMPNPPGILPPLRGGGRSGRTGEGQLSVRPWQGSGRPTILPDSPVRKSARPTDLGWNLGRALCLAVARGTTMIMGRWHQRGHPRSPRSERSPIKMEK
jgi:hypothetical protein